MTCRLVLLNEAAELYKGTTLDGFTVAVYVHVDGFSGHAGTVPMDQRQDALAASARLVSDLERTCRGHPRWREEMLVCVAWIPKATVQVRAYHSPCPVDLYFAVVAHITLTSYLLIMFAT